MYDHPIAPRLKRIFRSQMLWSFGGGALVGIVFWVVEKRYKAKKYGAVRDGRDKYNATKMGEPCDTEDQFREHLTNLGVANLDFIDKIKDR